MYAQSLSRFGRAPARALSRSLAAIALVFGALLAAGHEARAATPPSGSLSNSTPSCSWTGSITGVVTEVGETACVDGVSCDSFQVVLQPGDYTGKQVEVQITWSLGTNDYDLYVHRGTLRGPVYPAANGGPPGTEEHVFLNIDTGVITTPIVWWAHIQASTVPPGQTYNGTAAIVPLPNAPTITYLPGNLTFSHTVPLFARGTVRDEEPSVRVDVRGNCYVGAIRGAPAGVDMWRFDLNPFSPTFDPEMRNGSYLGQPDAFQQMGAGDSTAGGADGGGDIEIATSFPTAPNQAPVVTMVSLAVADISSSVSTDLGQTWQHNAAAADIASDDRQWIEADGPDTIYLVYRAPVPSTTLFCQKSTDHGMTYGPAVPIANTVNPTDLTTPGYIAVDHANNIVYFVHQNSNAAYVSRSTDGGTTWTTVLLDNQTGHGHLFDCIKVGDDGTVYTLWSNERHILYSYSTDHGQTWSTPGIVDNPDASLTNVFPWLAAGSAGRIDVVWFGTTSLNIDAAEWDVYFSQSLNANTNTPTFRQQVISDHRIHGKDISEGGLTGAADRNLGDYFQIAYDPQGAAVVAFADDHNDFDGNTYVTRQLDGTSLLASAGGGSGKVNPVAQTELPLPEFNQPEVTDPAHDAVIETQPVPADNPFDILSITYFANNDGPNGPYLGARMKLSGLTTAPPPGIWRIAFTANAPWVTDQRPNGDSDQGDMFYLLATDTSATPSFSYGTAYRDSNPLVPVVSAAYAMAYNPAAGAADSGSVDTTTSTVTVKVALSKINALLPAGHPLLGRGSWLSGLRGSAGTVGNGPHDNARGGLFNYYINFDNFAGVGPSGAGTRFAVSAWPNPARGESEIRYSVPVTGRASVAIYDVQGRMVRSLRSGRIDAGSHAEHWDGTIASGRPAPDGVYFARVQIEGRQTSSRFVLLR